MVRFASVCLALIVTAALCTPVCFAQNKESKERSAQEKKDDQKTKNEKEDVKQAQDKLKGDQKELQAAQKALDGTESKEKAARQKLDEVRKRISAKYEKNTGIDKALADQDAAKKLYDDAAAPVLKALQEKPEYQAAAKQTAEAEARLKSIRADESLSADAKRKAIAQASRDKMAISDLEQKTLTDNPPAKTARARLADAQERVNEIRIKVRTLIDSDPEINSLLQAMRDAAEDTEEAGEKVKRIRDKIAADAAKLNREQQQVKQAESQDKLNDRQNKTPPKTSKRK